MFSDNPYNDVIAVCLVILVSYFFGIIARRTNIASVLLLILLGIGLQFGLEAADIPLGRNMFNMLQVLGIVGLIMIVLEASLDLTLTREKRPLIVRSFRIALLALIGETYLLTWITNPFNIHDFSTALVYAVPPSTMSTCIILPRVVVLPETKKEFMIYEST